MDLTQNFFTKNSIVTILSLTLTFSIVLILCFPSSSSYAQTYFPRSNIYPYTPTYPTNPYTPTYPTNPYTPTYPTNPYTPTYPTNPYTPTSNIYPYPPTYPTNPYTPSQDNFPFLGLAQYGLRQAVSPWFPSIPAISCGLGKFSFNILGVPDKGGEPEQDELMAVKIIASNNGRIITDKDVSGLIFVGEENIEDNDGEDFDIKTLFNDCQTLMYSR